jgi:hypothetical protein
MLRAVERLTVSVILYMHIVAAFMYLCMNNCRRFSSCCDLLAIFMCTLTLWHATICHLTELERKIDAAISCAGAVTGLLCWITIH